MNQNFADADRHQVTIFRAKYQLPVLAANALIRRPLLERLKNLSGIKLIVLSAPVGFGKTTLTLMAGQQFEWHTAWLSLDAQDDHPARFWYGLTQAIAAAHPDFRATAPDILNATGSLDHRRQVELIITALEEIPYKHVIVLDDYHLITDPIIHADMMHLLQVLPANAHIIMTTRTEPPLKLKRMQVNHQLIYLTERDLKFEPDETAVFLNEMRGLDVTYSELSQLNQKLEGWPAGLQIASQLLQKTRSVSAILNQQNSHNRDYADYLTEEVLVHLPDETRQFLMKTSILPLLHPDLCETITGDASSGDVLQELEQANLFIQPIANEPDSYRYHGLFSDFLQRRLHARYSPDDIQQLNQRACDWYAENGYAEHAIQHALAIADYHRAAEFLAVASYGFMLRGDVTTLLHWLKQIPSDVIAERFDLLLLQIWAHLFVGDLETVERLLDDFLVVTQKDNLWESLQGEILCVQSELARLRGDLGACVSFADLALKEMPEGNVLSRGVLLVNLGYIEWMQGKLAQAHELFDQMITDEQGTYPQLISAIAQNYKARLMLESGQLNTTQNLYRDILHTIRDRECELSPVLGMTYIGLAEVAYHRNHLDDAVQYARQGIQRVQPWMIVRNLISGYITLIRAYHALGDYSDRDRTLAEAFEVANQLRLTTGHRYLSALQTRIALAEGQQSVNIDWYNQLDQAKLVTPAYVYETLTLARVRMAHGRIGDVYELLEHHRELAIQHKRYLHLIDIELLRAITYHVSKNHEMAQTALHTALTHAQPEGFVRLILNQGARIQPLLKSYTSRSSLMKDFVGQLLHQLAAKHKPTRTISLQKPTLVTPLTERELEIVELLARGMTNEEIAKTVSLSVGTVKNHITNILGKLNVGNRSEIIIRAIQLKLIQFE